MQARVAGRACFWNGEKPVTLKPCIVL
ncbi:hypothetical protein BCEP4_1700006 [Burkholderia cepacia]|nr:hypothetical protein BCEP4_1700006 [Burkholderia cepacia]